MAKLLALAVMLLCLIAASASMGFPSSLLTPMSFTVSSQGAATPFASSRPGPLMMDSACLGSADLICPSRCPVQYDQLLILIGVWAYCLGLDLELLPHFAFHPC